MAYLGKTPSQAVRSRYYFTATGGETSLSGTDDNSNTLTFTDGNYVDVALNGVTLVAGTDYNTTTANTIGGLTALVASDVVEVIVYDTFSVFGGNMAANLNFKDNVKANFGTGNDLQIFHDAANSIINDAGTGNLQLQLGGSNKLEVTSTGIDVTGTVTADGLTVDTSDQVIINHSGDGGGIRIDSTNNTNTGSLRFGDAADNYIGAVEYNHSTDALSFYANNATRMTITSTGFVGIGCTPDSALEIRTATNSSSDTTYLKLSNLGENVGHIDFENGNGNLARITGTKLGSGASANDGILTFSTAFNAVLSERMRIDGATGNVLVGTTGALITGTAKLSVNGQIEAVTSNTPVIDIARTDGSGTLINFRQAGGAVVGSIGSEGGDSLYILSGDTGIRFSGGADVIIPVTTNGAVRDNAIDLGMSSSRFKDLYLSGGAYLGGTGSANHLDDYEEGTWTPASGGGTAPTGSGTFIKIGRSVTIMGDVTFTGVTSPTYSITGLPFQANGVQAGACIAWNNSSRYLSLLAPPSTSTLHLYDQQGSIQNINNNNRIIFSLTYQS